MRYPQHRPSPSILDGPAGPLAYVLDTPPRGEELLTLESNSSRPKGGTAAQGVPTNLHCPDCNSRLFLGLYFRLICPRCDLVLPHLK